MKIAIVYPFTSFQIMSYVSCIEVHEMKHYKKNRSVVILSCMCFLNLII